jgi:pSer/pThr/pTyr-binding forkhead associated (FHA) protein
MLKLKVEGDNREGIWLVEPKVSVGRAFTNNLIVNDTQVDDTHVEIWARGEELIVNRCSEQPVILNGQQLETKARLRVNDQITIGTTKLVVIDPKAERGELGADTVAPIESAESTPWRLESLQSGLSRNDYEIKNGTVVGRSNDCDIVILLAHLSRRHAEFKVQDDTLEVVDLNSSNGTFVNGKPVTHAAVNHGDEIRFDTLAFKVNGPVNEDLDKTMVRPMSVNELNSQLDQKTKSAPVKSKSQSVTSPNPNKPRTQPKTDNQVEFEKSNLTTKLIISIAAVLALLIIAIIVFVF